MALFLIPDLDAVELQREVIKFIKKLKRQVMT